MLQCCRQYIPGLLAVLNGMLKSAGAISLSPEKPCRFCGMFQFHILLISFLKLYIINQVSSSLMRPRFHLPESSSCKCVYTWNPGQYTTVFVSKPWRIILQWHKLECMFAMAQCSCIEETLPLVKAFILVNTLKI